jgi:gephyrin
MNSENEQLRPAILIISDTAFRDPATDKAGDILCQTFASEGGDKWTEPLIETVPDDATRIELAVRRWTDDEKNYVNLVVTTGGTGFAVKDITPEVGCPFWNYLRNISRCIIEIGLTSTQVITPLISRPAPGLM